MTQQRPLILRSLTCQILAWCLFLLLAGGALAGWRYQSLASTLENESNILHRLASQRADQHDAHLTALSAVANTTGDTQHALFLDVAATIAHFYPRIDDIQLVPLDASEGSVGIGPLTPVLAQQVREAAIKSDGQLALLPYPEHADHYMLVKRSPNTDDARYGLMLGIDAGQLLGEASPFWSKPGTLLQLSMPGGHVLVSHLPAATEAVHFSKALASASQPLALETGMTIEPGDLFPPVETVLTLMLVSAAYIAVLAAWRQRVRTRAAVEQARLSALESRLAHASRVNALGEMASGLAHELTQPLTAILAEAQACRRMLSQGGSGPSLTPVLEDTIAQAKRASSILERFRNWSRPQPVCVTMFDLRDALDNVRALLASQAASCNARLTFNMPATIVPVKADPVEMEQVVFNLVRNGLEAVATQDAGQVTVTLRQTVSEIILDVSDNGPGVAPELRDRLFTPFTTNRPDGTGLGLTLSQRLIERANGDIFLVDEGPGATFRIILKTQNQYMESTP